MKAFARCALAALFVLLAGRAHAQNEFATATPGKTTQSVVTMCVGASSVAAPCGNVDTGALITLTAAGAGTTNSPDQTNGWGRGVQIGINVTLATTTSMVINIQGKDTASGQYYTILSSAAITSTGFTNLTVYPGVTAASNAAASMVLPHIWRVQAVITGGSASTTATIGASVIN